MMEIPANSTILDILLAALLLYIVLRIFLMHLNRFSHPLPPGPNPLPLIGNALDFPKGHEGRFWAKHKDLYGPISSVTTLGTSYIIVNDLDVAVELLEKRSANYSSRPVFVFGGKLVGADRLTTFLPYGPVLKFHRRLMQTYVGTRVSMRNIEKVETLEAKRFLLRLLEQPNNFRQHIRTFAGAIILKLAYGYSIGPDGNDPLVDLAEEMMERVLFPSCMSGIWMVDLLPSLQYLPEWFPGMGFKKQARKWSKVMSEFFEKPYAFVKGQMASGKALPSFASHLIEKGYTDNAEKEQKVKDAVGTLFSGGADTTSSAITTFLLAMLLYPHALARAQEEVDTVIGNDRLPTFEDRENLPYINALMKEVLRWEPPVPAAFAHLVEEDDIYEGYRIPRGSIVIPNSWHMTHDPRVYKNPSVFNPERFLGEETEPDSYVPAFGFGRRVCPGKRIADHTLFIATATVVATFQINKVKDELGCDVEADCVYLPGIVSHPTPFACSITPRSRKAELLIRSVLAEHPFEKGDGGILRSL